MDPIKKLCERLEEVGKQVGLELHTFAVLPNMDGGPHMVQAMWVMDEEAQQQAAQQAAASAVPEHERIEDADMAAKTNALFEEMMKGQQKSEEEQKVDDAAASALRMAQDLMKGQLPSNDPPEAEAS
jgi:hypothetical protein